MSLEEVRRKYPAPVSYTHIDVYKRQEEYRAFLKRLHPKLMLNMRITIPLYRVRYSYTTRRGNTRQSEKFFFAPENKFAAEVPLTTQELRKMDGEQVFCLDMNEEVRVVARKKGFIQVTNDKEIHLITGLTLYRHRPSWCQ